MLSGIAVFLLGALLTTPFLAVGFRWFRITAYRNVARVRSKTAVLLALTLGLAVMVPALARAEEHHATRLGYPSTRFAPPLSTPEDVRARFSDPKLRPDFATVLRDWAWPGNIDDLFRAALTTNIVERPIPIGGYMPFMTTRRNGKPILLRNVYWEGKEPVPAYAFLFVSNGRRYRCVMPKPCSNFYLEDIGSDKPALELIKTAPAQVSLCDPIEMKIVVRNIGEVPATQVRVTDTLPPGFKPLDEKLLAGLDTGTLEPGHGMEYKFYVIASAPGTYTNLATVVCAEGVTTNASSVTLVQGPVLAIDCGAPAERIAGRAAHVCLTLRNTGDAAEPKAIVTLPIPEGATASDISAGGVFADGKVTWEVLNLAPHGNLEVCAGIKLAKVDSLTFTPSVRGTCSQAAAASECTTRYIGVPAVLLEAVDEEDPIQVGESVTYVIRVTNQGFADLTNVRMVCKFPPSQSFVSGSGSTSVGLQEGIVVMDPIPTMEPKAKASWRVVMKAVQPDDVRFNVELTSDQFTSPIHENESTRQY